MCNESKSGGISRRNFLGKLGTGVAGTMVAVPAMKNLPEKLSEEIEYQPGKNEFLNLTVNGRKIRRLVSCSSTLAEFLRDKLQLTGTKISCNNGECGGCTVLVNNKAVYSCHFLALDAEGAEVITIEGLIDGEKLHPLQEAFIKEDGLQCGFCTPGQIMAAYALLLENPKPSRDEIIEAMSGNLCRCSAYPNIIKSVEAAVGQV